ncbi:MAG: MFS transporter [Candidatus Cryptobacteroides sp.]
MREDKLWNSNFIKVCMGNFLIKFSFTLIVPLLPLYLSETFGAHNDTIGIVLSCYTLMVILVSPLSGYIVDSFPRKAVLILCNFLFFALFAGYIFAGSLTVFAIFRTIHGAPFGTSVVSTNTVAIDVLPSSRRTEGISYFGLSNNLATALGPFAAVFVLQASGGNYQRLFLFSMLIALCALIVNSTVKIDKKSYVNSSPKLISLDRFFLLNGFRQALNVLCFAFSYGVISTYVAIYGKEELGVVTGTGYWFLFFAIGLMISRITGAKNLKNNKISLNTAEGILVSVLGYFIFAVFKSPWAFYLTPFIIGLGNGHMYPGFQSMFVNLAHNSQRGTANSSMLTSWEAGVGLGVLLGGVFSEHWGYHCAFYLALAVNVLGILFYFFISKPHFEANKLR